MPISPFSRSAAEMTRRGFTCAKVEHWNSFARRRIDLFGFIDMLCIKPGIQDVGLQVTTTDHVSDHIDKITNECEEKAMIWLESGHRILVHGWAKRGGRGERKIWTLMERELILNCNRIIEKIPAVPPLPQVA